jgi:type IV fimbrial biogenesis protein FimT
MMSQIHFHDCTPQSARGFTLIELVITLVVLSVGSALAIGSFQWFVESNRLAAATNDFSADVSYARTEAIKRQGGNTGRGQVVMCVSANGATCGAAPTTWLSGWLIYWDQDNDGAFITANGDVLLKTHPALPNGFTLVTQPANTVQLAFNRLGALTSAVTSLQVTNTHLNRNSLVCFSGGTGRALLAPSGGACP